MLWVLLILGLLPDMDQECPPWPCGPLDLLLQWVPFLSSLWLFSLDLQVLKWFFFHIYDISCPILGTHLMGGPGHTCWHALLELPLPLLLLLYLDLKVLISSMVATIATPPVALCWLKSFTMHSYSLACSRRLLYVTSSCSFCCFTISLSWSICLHERVALSDIPPFPFLVLYWHFSTNCLICWSSWSVVSCSPCLMSLYISSV